MSRGRVEDIPGNQIRLGALPEGAMNTDLPTEGSPLVMRGQGVDCNRVAVDTDACNLNVPEVAINTQER